MTRSLSAGDFQLDSEDRGPVRLWSWERPSRRNAMQREAWELLATEAEALAAEVQDPAQGPRCLVLYGRGGVFAAGADLTEMAEFDAPAAEAFLHAVERLLAGLERLPILTLAAVEGAALGGGLELALACDLRLASDDAVLGIPAARLGAALTHALVRRLARTAGRAAAAEMLLSGRRVQAAEAVTMGLVQRLAPHGETLAAALDWAAAVAANAPLSVRSIKQGLSSADGGPGGAGAAADTAPGDLARFVEGCLSEDFHEGVAAFLGRRPPRFRGR